VPCDLPRRRTAQYSNHNIRSIYRLGRFEFLERLSTWKCLAQLPFRSVVAEHDAAYCGGIKGLPTVVRGTSGCFIDLASQIHRQVVQKMTKLRLKI